MFCNQNYKIVELKNICPNNCRVCIIKCEIIYKNLKNIPNCWNKNCEKNIGNDIKKELIESKNTVIEKEKNIEYLDYNENSIVINENIQQKSVPDESPISSKLNKQINLSYRDSIVEKFIQNNNLNDDPKYNSMENNNKIEKNMIEKSNPINNYFENRQTTNNHYSKIEEQVH